MNRNSAVRLIEKHGLKLLRWNGSFTVATVRTPSGETAELHTDGDRARMLKRLKQFKPASGAV